MFFSGRQRLCARARASLSEVPEIPRSEFVWARLRRISHSAHPPPPQSTDSPSSVADPPHRLDKVRRIGSGRFERRDGGRWVEPVNIMGIGFKSGTLFVAPRRNENIYHSRTCQIVCVSASFRGESAPQPSPACENKAEDPANVTAMRIFLSPRD